MAFCARFMVAMGSAVAIFLYAFPSAAQLGERLSAYTGRNAHGYLGPLVDAFGADLNAGLFHSARVPRQGFYLSLEIRGMSVYFADNDRTFMAITEEGFRPEQTTEAPTVVGSTRAVFVDGLGVPSLRFLVDSISNRFHSLCRSFGLDRYSELKP